MPVLTNDTAACAFEFRLAQIQVQRSLSGIDKHLRVGRKDVEFALGLRLITQRQADLTVRLFEQAALDRKTAMAREVAA